MDATPLRGGGVDSQGHASGAVELTISDDALILRQGFAVVVRREDVVEVRVRMPRPWQAPPFGPLLSVRTAPDARWRHLFWGPLFERPSHLEQILRSHGWPLHPERT